MGRRRVSSALKGLDKSHLNNMSYFFIKKTHGRIDENLSGKNNGGFTLIEMLVSLAVFTIVLFIATSSFLSIVNSDRKSRATRVATDNLNVALEDMSRRIKTGLAYDCGGGGAPLDCSAPSDAFSFTDQNGKFLMYKWGSGNGAIIVGNAASGCGSGYSGGQGCILISEDGGATFLTSTGSDIDVKNLDFYVSGAAPWPDTKQPGVVIAVDGSLGSQTSTKVAFKIQTSITQRQYDH